MGVCLECVPWDAALLAKGLGGLSARTGRHFVSPQSCSPFLPLGGGEGTQAGRASVFMFWVHWLPVLGGSTYVCEWHWRGSEV